MDTTNIDAQDRADMQRLVGGHDAALNDLMERHAAAVFHFVYRMVRNEDDANDLAQETFVRVYRSSKSYDPEQKFSTWLFTIAANLARNHLRWRSRHPNVSLDAESNATEQSLGSAIAASTDTPRQATEAAERAKAVRAAVHELPGDMREVIVLCEWEDMPVADAAGVLHTTPKAVESRLYRARKLLRESLKNWL